MALNALIDWISLTRPDTVVNAMYMLGLHDVSWYEEKGFDGFRKSLKHHGITINYDPCFESLAGYVMVTLSGQGCRTMETYGYSLQEFLTNTLEWNITRLDIAIDETTDSDEIPYLDMGVIQSHIQHIPKKYVGKWQEYESRFGSKGSSANFGSRSSRSYLRIYDKRCEQMKSKAPEELPDRWIRAELMFRDEMAHSARIQIIENADKLGEQMMGILKDSITFTDDTENDHSIGNFKRDCHVSEWWRMFLKGVSKVHLKGGPTTARTYDSVYRWLTEQTTRGMAIVQRVEGQTFIDNLIAEGASKLRKKDMDIIEDELAVLEMFRLPKNASARLRKSSRLASLEVEPVSGEADRMNNSTGQIDPLQVRQQLTISSLLE
jgi:hypothetical protein